VCCSVLSTEAGGIMPEGTVPLLPDGLCCMCCMCCSALQCVAGGSMPLPRLSVLQRVALCCKHRPKTKQKNHLFSTRQGVWLHHRVGDIQNKFVICRWFVEFVKFRWLIEFVELTWLVDFVSGSLCVDVVFKCLVEFVICVDVIFRYFDEFVIRGWLIDLVRLRCMIESLTFTEGDSLSSWHLEISQSSSDLYDMLSGWYFTLLMSSSWYVEDSLSSWHFENSLSSWYSDASLRLRCRRWLIELVICRRLTEFVTFRRLIEFVILRCLIELVICRRPTENGAIRRLFQQNSSCSWDLIWGGFC